MAVTKAGERVEVLEDGAADNLVVVVTEANVEAAMQECEACKGELQPKLPRSTR